MKNRILTLLLSVPVLAGLSQNTDGNTPGVQKEILAKVSGMQELIPLAYRYLNNWNQTIIYENVEVVAKQNGEIISSGNKGSQFNKQQKALLANADVGSEITFNIRFRHIPLAGEKSQEAPETHTIDLKIAAAPAYEAEYPGGYEKLAAYINDRLKEKLANPWSQVKMPEARLLFIIDENGKATNIVITKSSSNPTIDKLLIDAINNMEKWQPAQNSRGEKVKEEIRVNLPLNTGGC